MEPALEYDVFDAERAETLRHEARTTLCVDCPHNDHWTTRGVLTGRCIYHDLPFADVGSMLTPDILNTTIQDACGWDVLEDDGEE